MLMIFEKFDLIWNKKNKIMIMKLGYWMKNEKFYDFFFL